MRQITLPCSVFSKFLLFSIYSLWKANPAPSDCSSAIKSSMLLKNLSMTHVYMTSVGHGQQELAASSHSCSLPFSPFTHRIPSSDLTSATKDIEIANVSRVRVGQAPKLHTQFTWLHYLVCIVEHYKRYPPVRDHPLVNGDKMPRIGCTLAPFSEILKNPPNLINLVDIGVLS